VSLETHYRLCPKCHRSVPTTTEERFCANDGVRMLDSCPRCQTAIRIPETHFCANCGLEYHSALPNASLQRPGHLNPSDPFAPSGSQSAPGPSWSLARRGRVASILAILTIAGIVALAWFSRLQVGAEGFVGEIAGTAMYIGLSVRDAQVFAYVCDGIRLGEWFKGRVGANGNIDLVAKSGSKLTATIARGTANGTLVLNQGRTHAIAMAPATGSSGLYRATRNGANTNVVAGWVVLREGAQRGVISINGKPFPAPPLDLKQLRVRVDEVGELQVQRADPTK
jgi:hypothetical protein